MAEAQTDSNSERKTRQYEKIISGLPLSELQKQFLHDRWLDQLVWFESKALANQRRYYVLRVMTIVGGLIVPALVSLNLRGDNVATALAWTTFALSLVVAIAAALDGFFKYGERWRSFRRVTELLKAHGWQYFELSGPYAAADHASAFTQFAAQVESVIQEDLKAFIAQGAQARSEAADSEAGKPPDDKPPAGQ